MSWQPIETAPNDGCFLVTDGTYIAEVFWRRTKSAGFPATTDGYIFTDATHWMPCPELPPRSDDSGETSGN